MDSSIPQQLDDLKVRANQILLATTHYGGKRAWFQGKLQYVDPSDLYAALLDGVVTDGVRWVDVGGGQTVLPWNERFAAQLASRARRLVAIDPSPNVLRNLLVHERHPCRLEDYRGPGGFDVATLRMVAEHIDQPAELTRKLAELIRPDGLVAVLTPNRWSPASIAARVIPNSLHPCFTRWLDGRAAEETFPTFYRMNTRFRLRRAFEEGG
ncbi:MAG: class I SAM-dependent methyltransferase, partial [Planctomycetaceae bacterium]